MQNSFSRGCKSDTCNYTPKLHPRVLQGEVCNAKLISEPLDH